MNPYKALLAPILIGFGVVVNLTLGPLPKKGFFTLLKEKFFK